MDKLIVYVNRCPRCKWRTEMQAIQDFANSSGAIVQVKRTDYDPQAREEALNHQIEVPFVYAPHNNKSIRLIGISIPDMDYLV